MTDEQNEKILAKLDMMTGQMNQMQVDMAGVKATYHGDIDNLKHRVGVVESWKDSQHDLDSVKHRVGVVESRQEGNSRTIVSLVISIFLIVLAAIVSFIFSWVSKGGGAHG